MYFTSEVQMIFSCSTDQPKAIVQPVSSILWNSESQTATITVTDESICFSTKEKETFIGKVTIPSTMFSSYAYISEREESNFTVNLAKFLKCIRIFNETSVELEIKAKTDAEIEICVIDPSSVTTCTISCLFNEISAEKNYSSFVPAFDISINSDALRELFRFPIDHKNNSYAVTLYANQILKKFSVSASGAYGDVVTEMPQTLAEWKRIENPEEVHCSFTPQSIIPFIHSLSLSEEAQIRISSSGILEARINVVSSSVIFIIEPQIEEN